MVEMRLGAIVPATEPDFSCCDSLFGGEMPCKGRPRPRRRVCFFLTPTEPSLTHCGSRTRETSHARQGTFVQPECIPKPSRKHPLEIQDLSAEEFPERAQAPTDVGVHWAEKLRRRVVAHWNGVRRQAMVETRLGAIVPATEPDFSCCDSLFGGERPCKGLPRPRRRVCFFLTPTEPSLTHCGSRTRETSHARQGTFVQPECIPKPSRKRPLEIQDLSAEEFPESLYALDSTTIDLCLSLFPWAKFRKHKAAVKMHTLLDLHGNIPTFI